MSGKTRPKSRRQMTIQTFRKIWGVRSIPPVQDSPYEDLDIDDMEIVLHELAHQTLLPAKYTFSIGRMRYATNEVDSHFIGKPNFIKDLHEIHALAIELLVSRRLGIWFPSYKLLESAADNTELYNARDKKSFQRFGRAVRKAMRLESVRFRVDVILTLFEKQWNVYYPRSPFSSTFARPLKEHTAASSSSTAKARASSSRPTPAWKEKKSSSSSTSMIRAGSSTTPLE
jgi:hypothetical protein